MEAEKRLQGQKISRNASAALVWVLSDTEKHARVVCRVVERGDAPKLWAVDRFDLHSDSWKAVLGRYPTAEVAKDAASEHFSKEIPKGAGSPGEFDSKESKREHEASMP